MIGKKQIRNREEEEEKEEQEQEDIYNNAVKERTST
jgi:hypothetical protein